MMWLELVVAWFVGSALLAVLAGKLLAGMSRAAGERGIDTASARIGRTGLAAPVVPVVPAVPVVPVAPAAALKPAA